MPLATTARSEGLPRDRAPAARWADGTHPPGPAVSWAAVIAGGAAAAALSLILLILGVGLGLSSVSPWAYDGASAVAIGVSTIVWLTVTQLLASAMGGYLAGRLRTRWLDLHTDEVYFRDTAHGFLAWAVASLATAAMLTSVIGSILGSGAQAGAVVVGGAAGPARSAVSAVAGSPAANPAGDGAPMGYFVDALFRRDPAASPPADERRAAHDAAEVGRIFMNAGRSQPLPPEDVRYIGQLVAQRTGLSPQDAQARVTDVVARAQARLLDAERAAREAADKARKASAYSALWLFVSLLGGAFVASLAATFGGQRRDA